MKRMNAAIVLAGGLAFPVVGCGSGNDASMMGPSGAPSPTGASLVSVAPQGGATAVAGSAFMVLRFSAPMGNGMEQYVDLHMGSLAGPTMPMNCLWSGDRTTLTCTPQGPLSPRTT